MSCLLLTGLLVVAAWYEVRRVEQGTLFALALPWDSPAMPHEIEDARGTAAQFLVPAVAFLAMAGGAIAVAGPRYVLPPLKSSRLRRWLTGCFLVSVVADLATTIWFFHDGGIDLEVHPGIRLFGYAYGRTSGPMLGKLVQAIGILMVSRLQERAGHVLLAVVTCFYVVAAVHNTMQML